MRTMRWRKLSPDEKEFVHQVKEQLKKGLHELDDIARALDMSTSGLWNKLNTLDYSIVKRGRLRRKRIPEQAAVP